MLQIFILILFLFASFANADTVNVPVGQGQAVEVTPSANTPEATAEPEPAPVKMPSRKKQKPDKTVQDDADEDEGNAKGDTYNFYFQKGSGPGSVEQGGGSQKVKPAPPQEPPSRAPKETQEREVPTVELQTGLMIGPDGATGVSLGAQFNFTPKFGVNLDLFAENFGNSSNSSSVGSSGISDDSTVSSASGGSVAATFTPLTLGEGSVPVRLSGMAGLMFLSLKSDHTYNYVGDGINSGSNSDTSSKVAAFAGISASAYFTKHFGTVGYFKLASDTKYSQFGVNVAWLF